MRQNRESGSLRSTSGGKQPSLLQKGSSCNCALFSVFFYAQLVFAQLRTRVYSNLVINIARYLGRKNVSFDLIRLGLQGKGSVTDEEINCLTASAASKVRGVYFC